MIFNAFVKYDNSGMIVETSRGIYDLEFDSMDSYEGYQKLKENNKLGDFHLDYDAIIWGDDFDLAEHGIHQLGRKLHV